jgi:hypothetical protein
MGRENAKDLPKVATRLHTKEDPIPALKDIKK